MEQIHELSDLELAMLLCLVGKHHYIIESEDDNLVLIKQELQLVWGLADAFSRKSLISHTDCFSSFWSIKCCNQM